MSTQRVSKCEGRFPQLRSELEAALEITGTPLNWMKLADVFDCVQPGMFLHDQPDNYFQPGQDQLRLAPAAIHASLVPLLGRITTVDDFTIENYLMINVSKGTTRTALSKYGSKEDLSEYLSGEGSLRSNFGIGGTDAIVSDSPFSLELWVPVKDREEHAATLGFWYRPFADKHIMVVDQLQAARTSVHVEAPFQQLLAAAERVAAAQGFDEIWVYPAAKHPLFIATPDRKPRFLAEFTDCYDKTALALGFTGDPMTYYQKRVR